MTYQDKSRLFDDIKQIVKSIYCWYPGKSQFMSRMFFGTFKLLEETSSYHLFFLLTISDCYCSDSFFIKMSLKFFIFVLILLLITKNCLLAIENVSNLFSILNVNIFFKIVSFQFLVRAAQTNITKYFLTKLFSKNKNTFYKIFNRKRKLKKD